MVKEIGLASIKIHFKPLNVIQGGISIWIEK